MAQMVNLTINDVKVNVPAGTLIVDAAKNAGIDIPVFCYHPKMEPVGMCRQCLVEVGRPMIDRATGQAVLDESGNPKLQFGPKLETACTTPVSEGMLVLTASEKAKAGQKEIIELLLTSHPLDCPVCDKGGECPLQNLTMGFGSSGSRFIFDEKQHAAKSVPLGELIYLDRERCIQCARCIRFRGHRRRTVLSFYQRGRAPNRHLLRAGIRLHLQRQHHRYLPGRRAHHGGLPLRRTSLGNEQRRLDLRAVRRGLQHHLQRPPRSQDGRQTGDQARHAAPERTGQ
jgi:NADH-quinone oxidoreductase subunit G